MAEIAVISSATGIVSLGLTVCNGIITYYSVLKDSDSTLQSMLEAVSELKKTLELISSKLENKSCIKDDARQRVEKSLLICTNSIKRLEKKLAKVTVTDDPSWKSKAITIRRKSLYPFKESTIIKMKELCSDCIEHLQLALDILHIDLELSTLSKLDDLNIKVVEVSQDVRNIKDNVIHGSMIQAIEWLSPLGGVYQGRQQEHYNVKGRQDRSGKSLLGSESFRQWLSHPGKILWCVGAPGVGKTVTASYVVNHLQNGTNQMNVCVAYVYCSYKDTQRETATNLMSSILQQILLQDSANVCGILDLFEKHTITKTRPNLNEISSLILAAVQQFPRTYIVVDALDECSDVDENRETFVAELTKLVPNASLFVISRPLPHLERRLTNADRIELKANDEDIVEYVKARIAISQRMRGHVKKDPSLLQTIVTEITFKVKGMFLMARLYMDSLITMITIRKVKAALDVLPEGLKEVYDEVLRRIREQSSEDAALAIRTLYWIFHATRPLTVGEIQCALAIEAGDSELDKDGEPDSDLLISACAGMAVIDRETNTINLVHYTAQEYFQHNATEVLEGGQVELSQTCITYLLFEGFADGPSSNDADLEHRLDSHPLLDYAAKYWGVHARQCAANLPHETLQLIIELLTQNLRVETISQISEIRHFKMSGYSQNFTRNLHGLSLAASLGLAEAVSALLEQDEGMDLDAQDSTGRTAMHHAISRARTSLRVHAASSGLLARANSWKIPSEPALAITNLLLSSGASPTKPDGSGQSPLHCAAAYNQVAIIEKLLSSGAEVSLTATDGYNGTALYRAVEAGHADTVQILLDRGSEIGVQNSYGQTVLHRAAEEGHVEIVELLLHRMRKDQGEDELRRLVNIKDWYGWTAMYRAADLGHADIAKMLSAAARRPPARVR